jgi:hypothetical protein
MSSRERPVGRMTISDARAMRSVVAVEFGGASMISRSNCDAARTACSTVPKRSTAITGSMADCSRRPCQLKLVPWDTSRSAIFTLQPAFAYSRATRRVRRPAIPSPERCCRRFRLAAQIGYSVSARSPPGLRVRWSRPSREWAPVPPIYTTARVSGPSVRRTSRSIGESIARCPARMRRESLPVKSSLTSFFVIPLAGARALSRQPINIDSTVVIGHINLASIDYGRVELVELKGNSQALRIPQHF